MVDVIVSGGGATFTGIDPYNEFFEDIDEDTPIRMATRPKESRHILIITGMSAMVFISVLVWLEFLREGYNYVVDQENHTVNVILNRLGFAIFITIIAIIAIFILNLLKK